ncbi:MAG: hypothetical protein ACYC3I_22165 [Gemmataceae bacterium]
MNLVRKDLPQPSSELPKMDAESWECRECLSKDEAERLLDWLESNGYSQREVSLAEDGSFTVRWRRGSRIPS